MIREWRLVELAELDGVEIEMKNEAMVVEGVHSVTAIGEDLLGGFFFEQAFAECQIFLRFFEFREEQTDHP